MLEGKPATAASDVFSLGLVLLELLTWRLPWAGVPTPQASLLLLCRAPAQGLSRCLRVCACLVGFQLACAQDGREFLLPGTWGLSYPIAAAALVMFLVCQALPAPLPCSTDPHACAAWRAAGGAGPRGFAWARGGQPVWSGQLLPTHEVGASLERRCSCGQLPWGRAAWPTFSVLEG